MEAVASHVTGESLSSVARGKRDSLLDRNRCLPTAGCTGGRTKEDVVKLATELKRKQDPEQLSELKEILLEHRDNIATFLEVDGALEALVKALSGQNSKLQMKAAYCLCNLSLGDQCVRIVKVAGPYLLVHLEGMNTYLTEVCAWTLGNLSRRDETCVNTLKKQGALHVLARLSRDADYNVQVAASYALSHFASAGYDMLTPEDLDELTGAALSLFEIEHPSSAYLMSVLSGNANCQMRLLREGTHMRALDFLFSAVRENVLKCVWHVRILGNLVTETSGEAALQVVSHRESQSPGGGGDTRTLFDVVEYVVKSGQIFLTRECCWLLGNLVNHGRKEVCDLVMESRVLDRIADPVRYLLIGTPSVRSPPSEQEANKERSTEDNVNCVKNSRG